MRGPHPAAREFPRAALAAVAAGALFEVRDRSFRVRGGDYRDVLGALLAASGVACGPIVGGTAAARLLGLDPDGRDRARAAALNDLGDRCDRGQYAGAAGRANLTRDLTGIEVGDADTQGRGILPG